ncbi:MAG: hypothetical protein OXN83_00830, partial [Oligoflexia bacterium]|nr:hypothetical protein [Oligoflexia bacterium]
MFILEVISALDRYKAKYAIIGGYALSFHGLVRATMDIDLAVLLNPVQLKNIEKALQSIGLTSRLPLNSADIAQFREEYIKKRNLIVWSFVDFKDPTRMVDILLTDSLRSFRVESLNFKSHRIRVVSLKDLLKLKQKSKRPKDLL